MCVQCIYKHVAHIECIVKRIYLLANSQVYNVTGDLLCLNYKLSVLDEI